MLYMLCVIAYVNCFECRITYAYYCWLPVDTCVNMYVLLCTLRRGMRYYTLLCSRAHHTFVKFVFVANGLNVREMSHIGMTTVEPGSVAKKTIRGDGNVSSLSSSSTPYVELDS